MSDRRTFTPPWRVGRDAHRKLLHSRPRRPGARLYLLRGRERPPYGSADLRRGATHRCEHREAAGLAEAAAVLNGRGPAGGELGQFSRRFYPNDINLIVYFD
jgi:hypothetical protein